MEAIKLTDLFRLLKLPKGSNPNVKCPENVEKVQKREVSALKIKKSTIQNVGYFETRGGGLDFQIFPKFK